jgi:hypothetical protein
LKQIAWNGRGCSLDKFRKIASTAAIVVGVAVTVGYALGLHAAFADQIDPLHGFCVAPLTCSDNGTVTAITTTNLPTFGFDKSPESGSGLFYLDALVPNSVAGAGSESFNINGTYTGNSSAQSVNMGDWTSGDLTKYLGRSTSPSNPLSGWLPTTQQYQSKATGYYVYDFSFGSVNFSKDNPLFSSKFAYPAGTIITAFLCASQSKGKCTSWVSTAQSCALAVEYVAKKIPEPASISLFVVGLMGAARLRRRKADSARGEVSFG